MKITQLEDYRDWCITLEMGIDLVSGWTAKDGSVNVSSEMIEKLGELVCNDRELLGELTGYSVRSNEQSGEDSKDSLPVP